jgi:hypothetical protein
MARLICGPGSPYGCGHEEEHRQAALLGWQRRRLGAHFMGSRQQHFLSKVVGEVQHAHAHPDHPGKIAFKQRDRWYALPRSEWYSLINAGREIDAEERREAKRKEAEARAIAEYEHAVADEQKRAERKARIEVNQRERAERSQRAMVRKVARAERAEVVKLLREVGGVRVERSRMTGQARDKGEWELLPAEVRRKDGRVTLDTARERVMEHMPWLALDTTDDLIQFFERSRVKTMRERYNARARRAYEAA